MYEWGPFGMFAKLRELVGIEHNSEGTVVSYRGEHHVLACFLCSSIWSAALLRLTLDAVSMPPVQAAPKKDFMLDVLSMSAVAILVDKYYG